MVNIHLPFFLSLQAMQVASEQHPGGMGSITGLKDDVLSWAFFQHRFQHSLSHPQSKP